MPSGVILYKVTFMHWAIEKDVDWAAFAGLVSPQNASQLLYKFLQSGIAAL